MVVLMALGFAAYFQLGQDEDPPFTFRAMVVQAFWPGATAQQMAEQVTDKIERTLQEVPYSGRDPQLHQAGRVADHPATEGLVAAQGSGGGLVPGAQEGRRHAWQPARRRDRAVLQRRVRRRLRHRSMPCRRMAFSTRNCASTPTRVRSRLLRVKDVAKVEIFGAQAEKVFVEISQKRLAQLGLDFNQVIAQLGRTRTRSRAPGRS
jgi:multidrug efflux pump